MCGLLHHQQPTQADAAPCAAGAAGCRQPTVRCRRSHALLANLCFPSPLQDDPLIKHCLDFVAVAAGARASQLTPTVAAALLSREAATAVLAVAGRSTEPRTQATALRTLYALCLAGGCGMPWQQLAAVAPAAAEPSADELVAACSALAGHTFAVTAAAASAAAPAGRAPVDVLAVQLYGLAAVGALQAAVEARATGAGAALAAALQEQQLAAAQDAVAAACAALARSPQLLAAPEAAPEGGEPVGFAVELDASEQCCHLAEWQEPVGWRPAVDAVRGVCRLLRCAPEGLNAADREGFTLLHRWGWGAAVLGARQLVGGPAAACTLVCSSRGTHRPLPPLSRSLQTGAGGAAGRAGAVFGRRWRPD